MVSAVRECVWRLWRLWISGQQQPAASTLVAAVCAGRLVAEEPLGVSSKGSTQTLLTTSIRTPAGSGCSRRHNAPPAAAAAFSSVRCIVVSPSRRLDPPVQRKHLRGAFSAGTACAYHARNSPPFGTWYLQSESIHGKHPLAGRERQQEAPQRTRAPAPPRLELVLPAVRPVQHLQRHRAVSALADAGQLRDGENRVVPGVVKPVHLERRARAARGAGDPHDPHVLVGLQIAEEVARGKTFV